MIDAHTHIHDALFDPDREEVLARARVAGVEMLLTIGTDLEESRRAVACAEEQQGVYVAVGLHPHFLNETREDLQGLMRTLREIAESSEKVVAIGECGLDYFSHDPLVRLTDAQKSFQREGCLAQMTLAQALALPLVLHIRPSAGTMDAYEDILDIVRGIPEQVVVLHCYMGDTDITRRFLELPQTYFSFAGNVTYPVKRAVIGTRDDLTETVKLIPRERLLVETDAPYLTPQSRRGQRNEPGYVGETARRVQTLLGVAEGAFEVGMRENFTRVFLA